MKERKPFRSYHNTAILTSHAIEEIEKELNLYTPLSSSQNFHVSFDLKLII